MGVTAYFDWVEVLLDLVTEDGRHLEVPEYSPAKVMLPRAGGVVEHTFPMAERYWGTIVAVAILPPGGIVPVYRIDVQPQCYIEQGITLRTTLHLAPLDVQTIADRIKRCPMMITGTHTPPAVEPCRCPMNWAGINHRPGCSRL